MQRQRRQCPFVGRGENSGVLVQGFKSPHDVPGLVPHRHRQHGSRLVARAVVDSGIEARIGIGVFHIDGFAGLHRVAGNPFGRVEAQNFGATQRDFGPQLAPLPVEQENAGPVAIQQVSGFARDQVQQTAQIPLGVHLLADRQNRCQFVIQVRQAHGTHRDPVYPIPRSLSTAWTVRTIL